MDHLIELVVPFLANNPHMAVVLTIMSVSRAVFKPVCSVLISYVESTPGDEDNKKLKAFMDSKGFKAFAYFMDLFLSIKLPQPK